MYAASPARSVRPKPSCSSTSNCLLGCVRALAISQRAYFARSMAHGYAGSQKCSCQCFPGPIPASEPSALRRTPLTPLSVRFVTKHPSCRPRIDPAAMTTQEPDRESQEPCMKPQGHHAITECASGDQSRTTTSHLRASTAPGTTCTSLEHVLALPGASTSTWQ